MKNLIKLVVFLMVFINLQSSYFSPVDHDSLLSDHTTRENSPIPGDISPIDFDTKTFNQMPSSTLIPFDGKRLKIFLEEYKIGDSLNTIQDIPLLPSHASHDKRFYFIMQLYNFYELKNAIIHNDVNLAHELLLSDIDVNMDNDQDDSLLEIAIMHRSYDVMPLLIQAGVNINRYNQYGITPLHIAATHNDVKAISLLLDAGALIDAPCKNMVEHQGQTPLCFALLNDAIEAQQLLLDKGANINIPAVQVILEQQKINNYNEAHNPDGSLIVID